MAAHIASLPRWLLGGFGFVFLLTPPADTPAVPSPLTAVDGTCTGCESNLEGTDFGENSLPCGTGSATLDITAGVVRQGECDEDCGTKTTCRFSYEVSLVIVGICVVRAQAWICPIANGANPTNPPCALSTAYYTGGFMSSSDGYDIICGRSEQIHYNVVNHQSGTGPALGELIFNCTACEPGGGG